jgi:arylsulfatase A-like enzyme
LSGKYQQRFGLDHNGTIPFPLEEVMIAERMKDAGYVTGMTGKWHLDPNRNQHAWINENMTEIAGREKYVDSDIPHEKKIPYLPTEKGFDYVMEGHVNTYWANYTLEGELIEKQLMHVEGYRLDIQSQAAVTFIEMNHDKPFFYYLSYFAPHVPLEATEKYLSRFPGEMPERRRMCLAMLAAIDDGVGSIKETLRKYDIEENTLIVFLGDNGAPLKLHKEDIPLSFKGGAWNGSLNEPYLGEKGMLSEAGTRVPFIMNWPDGLPKGMVYERPVISMDIAATSLALAGKEVPGELDGVNVIPYINGELDGDPHEALYWRFWHQSAIRMGDWKYLRYKEGEFLFNVANDVHENVNLISEYPEKATELKEKLIQWTDELKYPGLEMEGSPQLTKSYDFYF